MDPPDHWQTDEHDHSLLTLGFYLKQRRLFLVDREKRANREKTSVERWHNSLERVYDDFYMIFTDGTRRGSKADRLFAP